MARSILRAGKIAGVIIVAIIVVAVVLYSAGVLSIAQTDYPPPETTTSLESSPAEPTSDTTLGEQRKLVTACLTGDEPGDAVAAMDKLLTDFAQHEQLPGAVHNIVQRAVKAGKYQAVGEVCRALAENSSDPDSGVWVAMASALAVAYQGDDAALDAATEDLAASFSGDPRCIEAFGQIAYSFRKQKKYARSREFYQYVVDTWPNGPRAVFSQRGLVLTNLALGDTAAASAALDELLSRYGEEPDFVECVVPVARAYRKKKQFDIAIGIHQFIADNRADDPKAIRSQRQVFDIALVDLKDDAQADAAYQTLRRRFAEHERIAQAVCESAWAYRKLKRFEDSLRIYTEALTSWPDCDYAVIAQRGIVFSLVGLKDEQAAAVEVDKLLTGFFNDPKLAGTACALGDAFGREGFYAPALALYRHVADYHGDHPHAITAQRKVVTTYINLNDEEATQQALDELNLRFAGNAQLPKHIYAVGEHYRKRKNYPSARALYQHVIDTCPGTANAMWSSQRQIIMDIDETEDPNNPQPQIPDEILQAADDFIAGYAARSGMVKALLYAGEEYYRRAFRKDPQGLSAEAAVEFAKASTIFDRIIADAPVHTKYTGDAHYMTAVGLSRAGRYDEAIAYHQAVVDNWPDHHLAWSSLYWIGDFYQKFKRQGLLTTAEADAKSEEAFVGLLDNYPECSLVGHTLGRLGSLKYDARAFKEAVVFYEMFLEQEKEEGQAYNLVLYKLARSYEHLGKYSRAKELLTEFMTVSDSANPLRKAVKAILEKYNQTNLN